MKKKNKIIITISFSFLLFLIYFFLFPYESEKEICVKPSRAYNLEQIVDNLEKTNLINPPLSDDEKYMFQAGDIFGYLDKDENLRYIEQVLYNVALSDYGYINYSSIQDAHQSLVLMDTSGSYLQSFNIPGYPYFSQDGKRLFILKTDATGIREVTFDGDELWNAEFASIMTSFASNDEYGLVGLLNGLIKVYTKTGECIYNFKSQGSRLSVVYSTALSVDRKSMAIISGLDPQYLFFFKKGNANYHNPIKKEINAELRRPGYIGYTHEDKYLLYESSDRFHSMSIQSLKTATFPIKGRLTHIDTHSTSQYFIASFLPVEQTEFTDMCLGKPGNLVFSKYSSRGKISFLRFLYDSIIVGFDKQLLILELGEV